MYYTTLNKIQEYRPCREGWASLLRHLDKTGPDDEPLSLLTILDSNGIEDAIWALRAVDDPACERDARLFTVRCVRQVQHLLQDQRSLDALDVAERYAVGMATDKELRVARNAARDAAWDAAWAAAQAAARNTAQDAAWDAARNAAWAAAWDAAWDAARNAAWAATEADFRALFCAEEDA